MRNEEEERAGSFGRRDIKHIQHGLEPSHRADRKLESLIRGDVRQSSYHELGRVSCTVAGAVLTLTGRVSSYYLKQMAQQIAAERTRGDLTIENQLLVEP